MLLTKVGRETVPFEDQHEGLTVMREHNDVTRPTGWMDLLTVQPTTDCGGGGGALLHL